jgi:hypothetical protein
LKEEAGRQSREGTKRGRGLTGVRSLAFLTELFHESDEFEELDQLDGAIQLPRFRAFVRSTARVRPQILWRLN